MHSYFNDGPFQGSVHSANGQDRHGGLSQDRLRHAPQYEPTHAGTPVGGHHNEIDAMEAAHIENALRRISAVDKAKRRKAFGLGLCPGFSQVILGGRNPGFTFGDDDVEKDDARSEETAGL